MWFLSYHVCSNLLQQPLEANMPCQVNKNSVSVNQSISSSSYSVWLRDGHITPDCPISVFPETSAGSNRKKKISLSQGSHVFGSSSLWLSMILSCHRKITSQTAAWGNERWRDRDLMMFEAQKLELPSWLPLTGANDSCL